MLPTRPPNLAEAGFGFSHLDHVAAKGVTLEDVKNPDYWGPCIHRLSRNAVIDIVADDGSFDCQLRVVALGPTGDGPKLWAEVRVLREWTSGEAGTAAETDIGDDDAPDFAISFSRDHGELHRVIDKKTNRVAAKGLATLSQAKDARDNLRAQRRKAAA